MAEFKTQEVGVKELKVGDILIEKGIQWHIDHIKHYTMTTRLSCTWTKKGDMPRVQNVSFYRHHQQKSIRLAVDGHAEPCYDSDCACIFKEIDKVCENCENPRRFCWEHAQRLQMPGQYQYVVWGAPRRR